MESYRGEAIYKGIAIGKTRIFTGIRSEIKKEASGDALQERERFDEAREELKKDLAKLRDSAFSQAGKEGGDIFRAQEMLLVDEGFSDMVYQLIDRERVSAEYAVDEAGVFFSDMLGKTDDPYTRERAADVKDVSARLVRQLSGDGESAQQSTPAIVVAATLAPSEVVMLDKKAVLAIVLKEGSKNSHAAILIRNMGIPALTGIDIRKIGEGRSVIVDAYEGLLLVDPDEQTLTRAEKKQAEEKEKKQLLSDLLGKENATKSGRKIDLYANIGCVEDARQALLNDAAGIGLFRSEFLYLDRPDYPSEDEQYKAYREVADIMGEKPVIIRTVDIGADKQVRFFDPGKEENPALGMRAIRICLEHTKMFKTQLRALFRAAESGNILVMFPMIISLDEVRKIKELCNQVETELTAEGIPHKNPPLGIVIETPAAVIISDLLAAEVDFFSIGSNDLIQYTMALDRQNPGLSHLYDPRPEAVLRMIKTVVKNGHEKGIRVGICGEMAGDAALTETFIEMGVDELSVVPPMILPLRRTVRQLP